MWNVWVHSDKAFNGFYTKMGHAAYAAEGADFSAETVCPFADPEEVLAFRPTQKYGNIDRAAALKAINADYAENENFFLNLVAMTHKFIYADILIF